MFAKKSATRPFIIVELLPVEMPSASSKSEKPASTEAVDPLKQAIVIIGHKIRNLEKRKVKLDSYKDGVKTLTKEQVEAVAKYDEVVQQLELSKEYVKQFTVISVESDKTKKKQAKKDAQDKYAADLNKIKQILQIQNVLNNMVGKNARQDFLTGQNGAIQLTETDLKALDDLLVEISPKKKNFSEDGTPDDDDQFQKAAEVIMNVIEGKTKEVAGSTGAKLRDLVASIQSCGYFEKAPLEECTAHAKKIDGSQSEEKEFQENKDVLTNVIVPNQNSTEGNHLPVQNSAPIQPMMPGAPIVPGTQPLIQPNQHPILPPNVSNIVPTPVSQVESSFFNAQGFKPPAPPTLPPSNQNTRQINDVIQSVTGKFNFLQESELEISDLNSVVMPGNPPMTSGQIPTGNQAIPSQTFTNQNFNGQPGNGPAFPPNYNPQPAAFQTFVPAFPGFVPPNASPFDNTNPNVGNPVTVAPVNNPVNLSVTSSSGNTTTTTMNGTTNKCNNIQNPIPVPTNRNANLNFNQSQQHLSTGYPNQSNKPNITQPAPRQPTFPHGNMAVGGVDTKKIDETGRVENERKDKQENEKPDWTQPESSTWADDWTETSDWSPMTQNPSEANATANKFSSARPNRNSGGVPRNANGYQGNRNRTNRPGGYRDPQNTQGNASNNYYQNQNGYQSRGDRSSEYSVAKGTDFRDNFKERGDYNNRDRESYGGGFKRGPSNRGPNMRGPMDRGDKPPMQIPRSNPGGPRGIPRNLNNRPPPAGGRNGPGGFSRQQPNPAGAAAAMAK